MRSLADGGNRFYRWRRDGVWSAVLAELRSNAQADGKLDWTLNQVDSPVVRAHQHAAGEKGGRPGARTLARRVRDQDPPARLLMAMVAVRGPGPGRPRARPERVVADQAYSPGPIRRCLRGRSIGAVIPQPRSLHPAALMDWGAYRKGNVIERPHPPAAHLRNLPMDRPQFLSNTRQ
jgi:transposase